MMPHSKKGNPNIDIGLAVLCALVNPDQTLSIRNISDVCCCHPNAIHRIEKRALEKLRKNYRMQCIAHDYDYCA